MVDGIINVSQLADPNTQFTEVNMRNYKWATNTTTELLVEKHSRRNSARQLRYYGHETYGGERVRDRTLRIPRNGLSMIALDHIGMRSMILSARGISNFSHWMTLSNS